MTNSAAISKQVETQRKVGRSRNRKKPKNLSPQVQQELLSAVRDAKIRVIGQDLVKNDAEAAVLMAIVRAYGDTPSGFIYVAPSRARTTKRPPDVVLCHPEIGLLIIETKGIPISKIEGVEAGSIMFRYNGYIEPQNVIRQAEDQMFDIKDDLMRLVRDEHQMPLLNCMVAFPRISENEWRTKGYDQVHPTSQLLLFDQISTRSKLKSRISALVQDGLKLSKKPEPINLSHVELLERVFGNSDVIDASRPCRAELPQTSLGTLVDERMNQEKYLSAEQKALSRLEFDGTQRLIRGVAGSGKSIVLANLVARHLHRSLAQLQMPLWPDEKPRVAVTCFNRALVDFLRKKVQTAFKEQTLDAEIPATVLTIGHFNGLFGRLKANGWPLNYIRISDVKDSTTRAAQYREQIARWAARAPEQYESLCFDAIFVDEGQDFEPEEFKLLLDMIKPHPKTGEKPIVVFYDDAQNLYGRARPVWRDIGINVVGERSQVMKECFRNTRPIVELAFNVLLGSAAPAEMRALTRTYADIAYLKERGLVEESADFINVRFAERRGSPPRVNGFANETDEVRWVAQQISRLVCEEGVRREDILILFYRPSTFDHTQLESFVRSSVPDMEFVRPFGENESDKDQYIFHPGKLTISTVYGAKGYDAPIVFIVGADRFGTDTEGRAAFYVAATRAKMFLQITGVQDRNSLLEEAAAISEKLRKSEPAAA